MYQIRKATFEDLPQLSILFDLYRFFYGKKSDQKSAEKFLHERIQNGESEIFVAEETEGKLVGFVQLYPIFSSTRMKKLWLLNDLYVLEDHRGKGISVLLIEKAKELSRNTHACGLILETAKTNHIGNKLYPKTGFELDQDHNYYAWEE
ncbi:MAG: GNAT family N-acetyltransferase [Flavobacteriaceae bacterium]|nr:MAG: GNAT family N-acetyltransferase [Flavobacteriaceae bacterium]